MSVPAGAGASAGLASKHHGTDSSTASAQQHRLALQRASVMPYQPARSWLGQPSHSLFHFVVVQSDISVDRVCGHVCACTNRLLSDLGTAPDFTQATAHDMLACPDHTWSRGCKVMQGRRAPSRAHAHSWCAQAVPATLTPAVWTRALSAVRVDVNMHVPYSNITCSCANRAEAVPQSRLTVSAMKVSQADGAFARTLPRCKQKINVDK